MARCPRPRVLFFVVGRVRPPGLATIGATFRFPSAVSHSSEHFSGFRLIDKAIRVGIQAFERASQYGGRFVLRDFAVIVGVGFFKALTEFFGIDAAKSALRR